MNRLNYLECELLYQSLKTILESLYLNRNTRRTECLIQMFVKNFPDVLSYDYDDLTIVMQNLVNRLKTYRLCRRKDN